MTKKEEELKQCPFCGKKAISVRSGNHYYISHSFGDCEVVNKRFSETEAEAIKVWNTRPETALDMFQRVMHYDGFIDMICSNIESDSIVDLFLYHSKTEIIKIIQKIEKELNNE